MTTGDIKTSFNSNQPGWLVCDGREMIIENHPILYGVLGGKYKKEGDSDKIFRLPDMRLSVIIGAATSAPNGTIKDSKFDYSTPDQNFNASKNVWIDYLIYVNE